MKIAFLSSGCQTGLTILREIIAGDPALTEVRSATRADLLVVNFCAISTEALAEWSKLRQQVLGYKAANPALRIMAGGCIASMPDPTVYDLSFADRIFHRYEATPVFLDLVAQLRGTPAESAASIAAEAATPPANTATETATSSVNATAGAEPPSSETNTPALAPYITQGRAQITIAEGCRRRCAFCKTNYLQHVELRSRPAAEILALVRQVAAADFGVR